MSRDRVTLLGAGLYLLAIVDSCLLETKEPIPIEHDDVETLKMIAECRTALKATERRRDTARWHRERRRR